MLISRIKIEQVKARRSACRNSIICFITSIKPSLRGGMIESQSTHPLLFCKRCTQAGVEWRDSSQRLISCDAFSKQAGSITIEIKTPEWLKVKLCFPSLDEASVYIDFFVNRNAIDCGPGSYTGDEAVEVSPEQGS